jgi:hypothetical protein
MTTTTIFGDTTDGRVQSTATTVYADARSGASGLSANAGEGFANLGQRLLTADYFCYEHFHAFDTSSIPDTDVITAVEFSLWSIANPTTNFVVEARLFDWGATLTTADWIAGASLSAQTLLASADTSTLPTADTAYWTLTSEAAFPPAINKTGFTRFMLCSANQTNNVAPTGNEFFVPLFAEEAGTTKDPRLVVTHSAIVEGESFSAKRSFVS